MRSEVPYSEIVDGEIRGFVNVFLNEFRRGRGKYVIIHEMLTIKVTITGATRHLSDWGIDGIFVVSRGRVIVL